MTSESSSVTEDNAVVRSRVSGGRINALEIGRGLAALAVVVFHANASAPHYGGPSFPWMRLLEYGVDFFFVLSGFIIFTAHGHEIGQTGRVVEYLKKRFIRLFPVLWAVVLGFMLLRLCAGVSMDVSTLLRSLFPYPSLEAPIPMVVWTLRFELMFYVAFALLLAAPKVGRLFFLLWGMACVAQLILSLAGNPVTGIPSMLVSSYIFDFFMGMGLAKLHSRHNFQATLSPLIAGLVALIAILAATYFFHLGRHGFVDYASVNATLWTMVRGIAFALVVHGLVCAETLINSNNPLILLGGSSYALYLVHTPANSILQRVAEYIPNAALQWGAGHIFLIAGGVVAGFAVHHMFERPATRYLKKRFAGRQT